MTTPTPRSDAALCRYTGGECVTFPAGIAYVVPYRFAQELERDLAAAHEWREAVLNELIVAHIYTKEHDTNPRKAIQDAITWNCQVALDPVVSSDAQKLIAAAQERAEKAEAERDELKRHAEAMAEELQWIACRYDDSKSTRECAADAYEMKSAAAQALHAYRAAQEKP